MKRRNEEDEIYNKRMPQKFFFSIVLQIIINSGGWVLQNAPK